MNYVALGETGMLVSKTGMAVADGVDSGDPSLIINEAYKEGVNFYDVSGGGRKIIGSALASVRRNIFIISDSSAKNASEIETDIRAILNDLSTDYLDLYLVTDEIFKESNLETVFLTLQSVKSSGLIRHIGLSINTPENAIGLLAKRDGWEVLKTPFNVLCSEELEKLVMKCYEDGIGFIASRPLCGGIVSNIPIAVGYLSQFSGTVPVWGPRSIDELQQILYFAVNPPAIDSKFKEEADKLRAFFS